MKLPRIVQRAPYIFYGLAILVFVSSWLLTIREIDAQLAFAEPGNPVATNLKLRGLYQALLEAIYISGTGVLAHILLAIWAGRVTEVPTESPRD